MAETTLTVVGVTLAAFCVWLTVRIINRRERWAKWTLAATIIGTPTLYVLSFGPACWLNERTSKEFILTTGDPDNGSYWDNGIGENVFRSAYKPFFKFAGQYPGWPEWGLRSRFLRWYAEVGTRNATLNVRGDGQFDWYRPDYPPFLIMDDTGTYVDNPARFVNPPAPTPDATSESN
ncbi:MAG: hypothetical protein ACM3U2_12545 [Deltaproteobacteria bacterium]